MIKVLWTLPFILPLTFVSRFFIAPDVRENRLKVNKIEYMLDNEYHPNIDDASLEAKQSNTSKNVSTTFERWALTALLLAPVLFLLRKKNTGENS